MIQYRRLATFLLGAWLAVSMCMDIVSTQNLRAADRTLGAPSVNALIRINAMGHEEARLFLRYFAAEQTRWYVEQWEWLQLALALSLILVLVFGTRPPKLPICLCLLMFCIVLVSRVGLTPWIDRMGRELDFRQAGAPLPRRFTALRDAYSIMELVKLALGFGVGGLLLLRKPADPQMFARESEKEELASRRRFAK